MKLDYILLDVFTTERLSGNPLAVFPRADGLLDDQMQRIARELSLSETVFVTKPKLERHTAAIRIFTPEVELPFAGHPTVGTAVALGRSPGSIGWMVTATLMSRPRASLRVAVISGRRLFSRYSLA